MALLEVNDLEVKYDEKEILKGISLKVNRGEIHLITGPNGAGKSVFCLAIMGDPNYEITEGRIIYEGQDLISTNVEERAKKGIFMSFQNPPEIEFISIWEFLRNLNNKIKKEDILKMAKGLGLDLDLGRGLNEGFSGGERKRFEILQMLILDPKLILLDEIDTGLDIEGIKIISEVINEEKRKGKGIIIVSHNMRIAKYVDVDMIHVLKDGKIVYESTNVSKVLEKLEKEGFKAFK